MAKELNDNFSTLEMSEMLGVNGGNVGTPVGLCPEAYDILAFIIGWFKKGVTRSEILLRQTARYNRLRCGVSRNYMQAKRLQNRNYKDS